MIRDALELLAELAADPTHGTNAQRALVRAPDVAAPPAVAAFLAESSVPWLARFQLDPACVATGPALLFNQAADVDVPGDPDTLTNAPGAVYAVTCVLADDGADDAASSASLAADAYDLLRCTARAWALAWARAGGAEAALARGASGRVVTFKRPALVRYAARQVDPGAGVCARTLLVTMQAVDRFVLGASVV